MTDLTEKLLALLVAGGIDLPAPPGRSTWALDALINGVMATPRP